MPHHHWGDDPEGDDDDLDAINKKLDYLLQYLKQMEKRIMSALDDLTAAVAAEDTIIDSAVTLLNGLKAALDAAGTDPTKLAALSADITAKTKQLADAVLADTPQAPAP